MYSALEKLRANATLTEKDKVIHAQGLVSVLQQLHDELDKAVFDAYRWPVTLTDEEILERLVRLNAERAEEELSGQIRWLRPEFQSLKGTTAMQRAIVDADEETASDEVVDLPTWPKKAGERFAAVRAALQSSSDAWTAERVVKRFKGAKREHVVDALEGLASLGLAVGWPSPEGDYWQAVQKVAK